MRILFAASRHAGSRHRQAISDALLSVVVCTRAPGPHVLIHGGGRGGDQIADQLARGWGWSVLVYQADWDRQGRAAGPLRNGRMVATGGADRVVAMPDGRGLDSGTGDLVRRAVKAGLPVDVRPLAIVEAMLL